VFLNARELSPSSLTTGEGLIGQKGDRMFSTRDQTLFRRGDRNEIVIADLNVGGGPSGVAFWIEITFSGP
jgi:hypothetical protein